MESSNSFNQYKEILEKLDNLAKIIDEKDTLIKNLAEKIRALEEKVGLEDEITKKDETEEIPEIVDVEIAPEIFKCSKCNFETKHETGLKIHMKRKHVRDSKPCDLCEKEFETVREMKMHRYTH